MAVRGQTTGQARVASIHDRHYRIVSPRFGPLLPPLREFGIRPDIGGRGSSGAFAKPCTKALRSPR